MTPGSGLGSLSENEKRPLNCNELVVTKSWMPGVFKVNPGSPSNQDEKYFWQRKKTNELDPRNLPVLLCNQDLKLKCIFLLFQNSSNLWLVDPTNSYLHAIKCCSLRFITGRSSFKLWDSLSDWLMSLLPKLKCHELEQQNFSSSYLMSLEMSSQNVSIFQPEYWNYTIY